MLMRLYPTEQEHFQNQPHRIVLTSAILHTREYWLKQIADDETEIDSQGTWWCTGAPVTGLPQLWSAFAEASIRIERIAGGCLRHRDGRLHTRTVQTPTYKLDTFCPHARNNDCALECLRHIATKHHIEITRTNLQLRKEYNIATNTFIAVDTVSDTLLALCTRFLPNRRVVVATTDFADETMDMTATLVASIKLRNFRPPLKEHI